MRGSCSQASVDSKRRTNIWIELDALHLSVGDHGGAAGADDTRAQAFLMQGKYEVAEKTARAAVRSLERGGEQSILAEALTTHGKALARLNQHEAAKTSLDRAIEVAQRGWRSR